MDSQLRTTFDTVGERARGYVGDAGRWGDRNLPGGARTVWVALALIVIVAVLWVLRPAAVPQQGRFGAGGPTPVGVAKAITTDINVTDDALGSVSPLATVTVRPQVSGTIVRIDFQEGSMVKAGDVLTEIDPRPFQAALDQAKGQLVRDTALLANARVDLSRFQALWDQKAISQQVRDTQAALVKQDEGIVESDKANVQTAAINLGYTKVTSPIAGRAGIRQVDVGNLVQAGQTSQIVVVTQLQPISILFSLPEDDLAQVMQQVNQGAKPAVEAYDRSQTTKLATGVLSAVDSQIDTTTGTVKMRAMFDNTDNALFPQQFVNVHLRVLTLHDQTSVPAAALQRGAQGSFVYAVNKDSTVSMRTIKTGVTDGDKVQVIQGLKPGDVVVVDGADRLRDGSEVILPKGQHGSGSATQSASTSAAPGAGGMRGRGGFMKILKKLTPAEHDQFCGLSHGDRRAWVSAHMAELMKRPDQPGEIKRCGGGGGAGFFGGGGGGPQ